MRGPEDYAQYRAGLSLDSPKKAWAAHYGDSFLGSLSGPITSDSIYKLMVPFGFCDEVIESSVIWEASPLVFGANLIYDQGVYTMTWQATMSVDDDGSISISEPLRRPLGIPDLDQVLGALAGWRLYGNLYSFEEAMLAAVQS